MRLAGNNLSAMQRREKKVYLQRIGCKFEVWSKRAQNHKAFVCPMLIQIVENSPVNSYRILLPLLRLLYIATIEIWNFQWKLAKCENGSFNYTHPLSTTKLAVEKSDVAHFSLSLFLALHLWHYKCILIFGCFVRTHCGIATFHFIHC